MYLTLYELFSSMRKPHLKSDREVLLELLSHLFYVWSILPYLFLIRKGEFINIAIILRDHQISSISSKCGAGNISIKP